MSAHLYSPPEHLRRVVTALDLAALLGFVDDPESRQIVLFRRSAVERRQRGDHAGRVGRKPTAVRVPQRLSEISTTCHSP